MWARSTFDICWTCVSGLSRVQYKLEGSLPGCRGDFEIPFKERDVVSISGSPNGNDSNISLPAHKASAAKARAQTRLLVMRKRSGSRLHRGKHSLLLQHSRLSLLQLHTEVRTQALSSRHGPEARNVIILGSRHKRPRVQQSNVHPCSKVTDML